MDFLNQIPTSVKIVAVTKNQTAEAVLNLSSRITDIAENKIQEAEQKFSQILLKRQFKTHFIGHLQTNKIKKCLQLFDVIQSVDSIKLAEKINKIAESQNPIEVMLQINVCGDSKKYGFTPELKQLQEITRKIKLLKNLKLTGLMTILKDSDNQKYQLEQFQKMENLFNQLNQTILIDEPLKYLSMGMSQDYTQALKANSNMLRLGTILFNSETQ